MKLHLFKTENAGRIVVAFTAKDARKVMREEWGDVFGLRALTGRIPVVLSGQEEQGERWVSETRLATEWGRGIAPEI